MINKLKPEQTIEILKLIHAKYNDYEYICTDEIVNQHWYHMEEVVAAASEKFDRRVEANRKNGKKGGAPKGNKNASKTTQNNPNNLKNMNMNMNMNKNKNIQYSIENIDASSSNDSFDKNSSFEDLFGGNI